MIDDTAVSDELAGVRNRVRVTVQSLLLQAQRMGWQDLDLSRATGVPARTIKSYRVEGKEPCLTNGLAIAKALGPEAVNALLSVISYSGASPADDDAVDPRKLVADLLPHISILATAAADGRIDHTELPGCQRAADSIIATVAPLASGRDGS